jgi:hypothetical protein
LGDDGQAQKNNGNETGVLPLHRDVCLRVARTSVGQRS